MHAFRRIAVMLLFLFPVSVFAEATGSLSTEETLKQLILLVSQYDARIKFLESENNILKNEMVKAGIKISLAEYTGAVVQNTTSSGSIPSVYLTGILANLTASSTTSTVSSGVVSAQFTAQYGADVSGFVNRIHKEWKDIRNAYSLPENANIGGYEFVQSGSGDYVFVDIVFGTGTTGIYDAKILYQFEKTQYKRKLVGFFEYNATTERYTTRSGSNPFAGVSRTFIQDPFFIGTVTTPTTATAASPSVSTSPTITSSGTTTQTPTGTSTVSLTDIEKAYSEKRYLSVISLSNSYLTANTPTYELLRIRYRTYFIIGKYTESLAEIAKIEAIGKLDKQTACDAQVIATYSKDTSLVTKYTAVCSGK
ncbi:MAG: hypothetical protein PHY14_03955 [Candidatus Gracilibacteria bacterium]|nr:hypothetical protein [Candidatus Gracilibacteria bacterium]